MLISIKLLPVCLESYGQDENIHATKGAALAMKARFALYMGDYEIAAKSC